MQHRKTLEQVEALLKLVTYKNWTLRVIEKGEDILIQWIFFAKDNCNPEDTTEYEQRCRKWYVSRYSTDSEVIRTAYKAVVVAEEHEINENFKVMDTPIFNPHADLAWLTALMTNAPEDVREPLKQNI